MPDIPNFNMQNNFPISSVIDAASRNAQLQQQALQAGNQSLVAGLTSIGQVGQSLYNQKLQMAQALAGAKMYAQTPEGQAMLSPTTTSTTTRAPVMRNQTAAYDPTTGSVTPNAGLSGVGATIPQTQTTTTPAPLKLQDIATAMLGESPSAIQQQAFDRQKQNQQFGLEQRKQALAEQIEPKKVNLEASIQSMLAGIKGQEAGTQATHVSNQDIDSLLQRRADLSKDLPTGWWNSINNDKAEEAKQQIAGIDSQLKAKGYSGDATKTKSSGGQFVTPNGTSYSFNP